MAVDGAREAAIEAHVARWIGAASRWGDPEPSGGAIDLLVVPPSRAAPVWAFVTCGLSARPVGGGGRAELVLAVPSEAMPVEVGPDFADHPRLGWTVRLLRHVAKSQRVDRGRLAVGDTCRGPDGAGPLGPGTRLSCALLAEPRRFGDGFARLSGPHGDVRFVAVVPITDAELRYKLQRGAAALFEALDAGDVDEVVIVDRASCALPPARGRVADRAPTRGVRALFEALIG